LLGLAHRAVGGLLQLPGDRLGRVFQAAFGGLVLVHLLHELIETIGKLHRVRLRRALVSRQAVGLRLVGVVELLVAVQALLERLGLGVLAKFVEMLGLDLTLDLLDDRLRLRHVLLEAHDRHAQLAAGHPVVLLAVEMKVVLHLHVEFENVAGLEVGPFEQGELPVVGQVIALALGIGVGGNPGGVLRDHVAVLHKVDHPVVLDARGLVVGGAVDDELRAQDAVVVLGHRLDIKRGIGRAVFAALGLFDGDRRRAVLADQQLVFLSAGVAEAVGIGGADGEAE
jgi:hypothetical protein